MRSTDFIDNSNARARQMARISDLTKKKEIENEKYYEENKCHGIDCRKILTQAEKKYSERVYKKHLCFNCQRKEQISER